MIIAQRMKYTHLLKPHARHLVEVGGLYGTTIETFPGPVKITVRGFTTSGLDDKNTKKYPSLIGHVDILIRIDSKKLLLWMGKQAHCPLVISKNTLRHKLRVNLIYIGQL